VMDTKLSGAEVKARAAQSKRDKKKADEKKPKSDVKTEDKEQKSHSNDKMVHHMSPYFNTLIPTVLNQGRAFPYTGVVRLDFTHALNETYILAATNTGTSGTVFSVGYLSPAGIVAYAVYTIPTIASADTAGGPTSGRSMKFSLGLVNTTPLLSRGGRITTLNGQSRLRIDNAPSTNNLATYNAIVAAIRGMPTAQSYDAAHFGEERQMSGSVVDSVTYEDYEEWLGTNSIDEFWEHISVWPGSTRRDRPMSTAWCVLSPPAVAQTYTITAKASYYTRWGLSTIPGQSQFDVPTAPATFINRIQSIASGMAETLHTVAEIGAASNALLPPMLNALEYVAPQGMLALMAA